MHLRSVIAVLGAGLAASASLLAVATTPKKTTPAASRTKKVARHKAKRRAARSNRRAGQMQPTPERYKEIQTALAQKGYLHGDPTGVWDQNSVDALRRFQHDQNLETSGKLDSLSLIALGLGPKH